MKGTNNYKVSTFGEKWDSLWISLNYWIFLFFYFKGEYLIVMLKKYLIIWTKKLETPIPLKRDGWMESLDQLNDL